MLFWRGEIEYVFEDNAQGPGLGLNFSALGQSTEVILNNNKFLFLMDNQYLWDNQELKYYL